jgi:hypothetical protein
MSEPSSEQALFIEALERTDPDTRRAFLDEACADKPELRRRIEQLLRLHEQPSSFMRDPSGDDQHDFDLP